MFTYCHGSATTPLIVGVNELEAPRLTPASEKSICVHVQSCVCPRETKKSTAWLSNVAGYRQVTAARRSVCAGVAVRYVARGRRGGGGGGGGGGRSRTVQQTGRLYS